MQTNRTDNQQIFGVASSRYVEDLSGSVKQHLLKVLGSHEARLQPFPHLVVDGVLPEDVFNRLAGDLPPFESLVLMSQAGMSSVSGYDRRAMLPFAELTGRADPEVWSSVAAALDSGEIEHILRRVFSPWITADIEALLERPLRREVRVHCDLSGSYLTPHTDAPSMFITSFIYIRCEAADPSLDTILYEPLNPMERLQEIEGREYAHEDPAHHKPVGRVEFRQNRMFSFLRTSTSVHGLNLVAEHAAPRHLISLHLKYAK